MPKFILDFEKPIVKLEEKIREMKSYSTEENVELSDEIERLEKKLKVLMKQTYSNLDRWQRVPGHRSPHRAGGSARNGAGAAPG